MTDEARTKTKKKKAKSPPLWGYIDRSGALVVPPTYLDADPFVGDLARVCDGRRWGWIDTRGAVAIPLAFADVSPTWIRGIAVVTHADGELAGQRAAVDRAGRLVDETRWTRDDGVVEVVDRASMIDDQDNVFGSRTFVFPDGAPAPGSPCGEGRFVVQGRYLGPKTTLFDAHGKKLATYADANHFFAFREGRARLGLSKGGFTFVRPDGSRLAGTWAEAEDFQEGFAVVALERGVYAHIDPEGHVVPMPAVARPKGRMRAPAGFERAGAFQGGRAIVGLGGKVGLIGRDGAFVVPPTWDTLHGPHAGHWFGARADADDGALVRADGTVVPLGGRVLDPIEGGPWWSIVRDDKIGVVDTEGQLVAPCEYDAAGTSGPVLAVNRGADADGEGGRWGYYDLLARREVIACRFLDVGSFGEAPLAPVLLPVGDESADYPFRFYGTAPAHWEGDAFSWRLAFVDAPKDDTRPKIEAFLAKRGLTVERWSGAHCLVATEAPEPFAAASKALEALHAKRALREVVLLEATEPSPDEPWEAWSVRRQPRPDPGPDFGLEGLFWPLA